MDLALHTDTVIIGGGPAGASCALWLSQLGVSTVLIERRARLGGLQLDSPYGNAWMVGLRDMPGEQFGARIHDQIVERGIDCRLGRSVTSVSGRSGRFEVGLDDGTSIRCARIVVATGVRPATGPWTPGPTVLVGPGHHVATHAFRGLSVAVLGGGDNAFENYAWIREAGAAAVHLYARSLRARSRLVELARPEDVHVGPHAIDVDRQRVGPRRYDRIVVMYGWVPVTGCIEPLGPRLDPRGFIRTDDRARTSVAGVYAVGEVTGRGHPCCATSIAAGVTAAVAIHRDVDAHWASRRWGLAA